MKRPRLNVAVRTSGDPWGKRRAEISLQHVSSPSYSHITGYVGADKPIAQDNIIVGVTQDNQIVQVDIENGVNPWSKEPQRDRGFSMSGDVVYPITEETAKEQAYDELVSLFENEDELRALNERNGTKFRSAESATEYVLSIDGELSNFDNSTMTDEIEYGGKTYLFGASGSGQIGLDQKWKKLYVDTQTLDHLNRLWKKYHLKKLPKTERIPIITQDRELILMDAIGTTRPSR